MLWPIDKVNTVKVQLWTTWIKDVWPCSIRRVFCFWKLTGCSMAFTIWLPASLDLLWWVWPPADCCGPTRRACLQGGHLGTGPLAPKVHYIHGGMLFLHNKSDHKSPSCQAIFTRFVCQTSDMTDRQTWQTDRQTDIDRTQKTVCVQVFI